MQYQSLTQEEQDLAIAQALHSREVEHFNYALNAANSAATAGNAALLKTKLAQFVSLVG